MVYTSSAVSIEHSYSGYALVFYSKQKPRVCTINHKPRHGTTVLYDAIVRADLRIWARFVHAALSTNQIRASLAARALHCQLAI